LTVTIFGLLIPLVALLILWRGTLVGMLIFVLGCTLMGGSATVILTALGNSSVPPANLALLFLMLRCAAPRHEVHHGFWSAVDANRWLALFVLYGTLGAFVLPRLFAGAIDLTPLRPIPGHGLTYAVPLAFSNQNLTVGVYLFGTLLAAVAATMATGRGDSWRPLAKAAAVIGTVHAGFGIGSVVLAGTPLNIIFSFFRNGFYAQLSHSFEGLSRMTGIFPEAAVFAAYGLVWLVFLAELWLRRVEPRWTGPAALLLLLTLAASTSSTAYLGLGVYTVILALRALAGGGALSANRVVVLALLALAAATAVVAVAVASPQLAERLLGFISELTVDKLDSGSGVQRAFWARQGVDAFWASYGLGVGVGSFRSSSILTAILGSVGIIGSIAFLAMLWRVFMPLRGSTWGQVTDPRVATGAAASWTAIVSLAPASVAAPSPDPGLLWGMMAGIALGLRWLPAPAAAASGYRHETVMQFGHGLAAPRT